MFKQKKFVIHTEDKKPKAVDKLVAEVLSNATIHRGTTGIYNGAVESSLVIEYVGPSHDEGTVRHLARQIKILNNQETVLITRQDVAAELI